MAGGKSNATEKRQSAKMRLAAIFPANAGRVSLWAFAFSLLTVVSVPDYLSRPPSTVFLPFHR